MQKYKHFHHKEMLSFKHLRALQQLSIVSDV